jgi:hypothetical protein
MGVEVSYKPLPDVPDVPDVPEEAIERPHGNMFGKLLNKYRLAKRNAIMDAKRKMFERHKVERHNEKYYKIVSDRVVLPNGKEVIELRLYQLIEGVVVTVNPDLTTEIEGGINHLLEFKSGG